MVYYKSKFSGSYNPDLDKKIATLAIKAELKTKQDKIGSFQAFDFVISMVKVILKMIASKII